MDELDLPKNVKDISGIRVGMLVVKKFSHIQNHRAVWLCDCDCGTKMVPKYGNLLTRKNPTKSCGCLQKNIAKNNVSKIISKNIGRIKGNKYIKNDKYYEGYDLNNNLFLIDADDYDRVSKHTWCFNNNGYFSTIINDKKIYLHRFILGCENDNRNVVVDHINGDRFDCRKDNLRKCDYFVNAWNSATVNKFGAKNIRKRGNKYEVRASYMGKSYNLGNYSNLQDAVEARIIFEKEHYSEYRREK